MLFRTIPKRKGFGKSLSIHTNKKPLLPAAEETAFTLV